MSHDSQIITLMDEILTQAQDEFASVFRTYEKTGGRFSLDEIKRLGRKADALLIGCLSFVDATQTGNHEYPLKMVVHIITKDKPGKDRAIQAVQKTEAIVHWLQDRDFELNGVDLPEKINATNLYNNKIDELGLTIWGIGFEITIGVC